MLNCHCEVRVTTAVLGICFLVATWSNLLNSGYAEKKSPLWISLGVVPDTTLGPINSSYLHSIN